MIICKICREKFESNKSMSWHVKHHNLTNKEYYDLYIKSDKEGVCLTCGKPTEFISMNKGYRQHCCKKCLNIDKNVQTKRLNTNIKKYGYPTSFSTKETQDKVKQTIQSKYGVSNPYAAEAVKQKIKETNLKKYGVENAQQRLEVKLRTQVTNMARYGNACSLQGETVKEKSKQTLQERYGAENIWGSEYGKQKIKETNLRRFGCENPQQNHEIHVKTMKHYRYDSLNFDSSWELAVYIYCIDHKIHIEREPLRFKYTNDEGKECYYFPDFIIEDKIIEIKGDQFLDEDLTLKDKAKQQCMNTHNVILWVRSDIQKYLDYCIEKFGDNQWYNQFR